MPLLGGIFSRKKPAPNSPSTASIHSTADSHADTSYASSSASHLHPDSARYGLPAPQRIPLSPTPSSSSVAPSTASTNTSKLRIFGRKKSAGAPVVPSSLSQTVAAASNPPAGRASTDDRRLRPPPSRSAIFAAYADPSNALSTRSLPNDTFQSDDHPDSQKPQPPLPPNPGLKRPSLFAWTNSKSSTPSGSPASSPNITNLNSASLGPSSSDQQPFPDSSFNLKSFRHVGSSPNPSSNALPNGSTSNLSNSNYPNSPTNHHPTQTNGFHTPTSQFHSPATNYFGNNDSNASLAPPVPRPRPRGASTASESNSAQRISVAAFREAQARRSQAGSPSPSLRSTSPLPGMPSRTKTPDHLTPSSGRGSGGATGPRPSRSASHVRGQAQRRRSSLAYGSSDSDPDDSEAEEDSDEGESEAMRAGGGRRSFTFDRPSAGRGVMKGRVKAKSEAGHGIAPSRIKTSDYPMPTTPSPNPNSRTGANASAGVQRSGPRSHAGHGGASPSTTNNYGRASQYVLNDKQGKEDAPPRSQSSLGSYGEMRPRASVSTSAVIPSRAAKRASLLAGSSPISPQAASPSSAAPFANRGPLASPSVPAPSPTSSSRPQQSQHTRGRANSSSSSSSNSSDDAPLATLLAPKRPGSAMSSYSNLTTRSMGNLKPKPLIDINSLTGGASPSNMPSRTNTQEAGHFAGEKEKSKEGFTEGRTLLSGLGVSGAGKDKQSPSPSSRRMSLAQEQQVLLPQHQQQFQHFQQHQKEVQQHPHSPLAHLQMPKSQPSSPPQPTSPLVESPTSMYPPVLSPLAPLAHLSSAPQTQPQPPAQSPLLSPTYSNAPRSPWQAPVHSMRDGIPAPPLEGPGDTGPLGQTMAPSNWVTPVSTPPKEVDAFDFVSGRDNELAREREKSSERGRGQSGEREDGAGGRRQPLRAATVDNVSAGPSSPEVGGSSTAGAARRDALADRLKGVVKQATSPPAATSPTLSSAPSPPPVQQTVNGGIKNQRSFSVGVSFPTSAPRSEVSTKPASRAPPVSSSPEYTREPSDEELRALIGNVSQFMSLAEDGELSTSPAGNKTMAAAQEQTQSGKQKSGSGKQKKRRVGIQSSSSESESSDSEGSSESEYEEARENVPGPGKRKQDEKPIAPIPIKQRSPPPAFSVTSRPPIARVRQTANSTSTSTSASNARSSISGTSILGGSDNGLNNADPPSTSTVKGRAPRPRSITLQHTSAGIGAPLASAPAAPPSHVSRKSYGGEGSFMPSLPSGSTSTSTSMSMSSSPSAATSLGSEQSRKGSGSPGTTPGSRQRSATLVTGVPLSAQMKDSQLQVPNGRVFSGSSAFASGGGASRQSAALSGNASSSGASAYSSANGKATSSSGSASSGAGMKQAPVKPFAESVATARRNSPASSTGDSSSGRSPFTPKDGSDIVSVSSRSGFTAGPRGVPPSSTADPRKAHAKRRSVSFEDDIQGELLPPSRNRFNKHSGAGSGSGSSAGGRTDDEGVNSNDEERAKEQKRRERRRSEAKAAIELGNVVNGRGPILSDDDDDMPINQTLNARMSQMNPMMGMGATQMMQMGMNPMQMAQNPMQMGQMGFSGSPSGAQWNMGMPGMNPMGNIPGMNQPMLSPQQFMSMVPPPADPNYLAAHQHAMAMAKQAYQFAVAQQAMAAAADEWERGSTMGGLGGGSVYGGGGGSVYGGGSQSVYGGGSSSMLNMMGGGGGWGATGSVYGGGARPMFGGSQLGLNDMMNSSRSEYGGGAGRPQNWSSSRSSYGESFGPDARKGAAGATRRTANTNSVARDSGYFPPVPAMPAASNRKPGSPSRSTGARKVASPPSSWRPA